MVKNRIGFGIILYAPYLAHATQPDVPPELLYAPLVLVAASPSLVGGFIGAVLPKPSYRASLAISLGIAAVLAAAFSAFWVGGGGAVVTVVVGACILAFVGHLLVFGAVAALRRAFAGTAARSDNGA